MSVYRLIKVMPPDSPATHWTDGSIARGVGGVQYAKAALKIQRPRQGQNQEDSQMEITAPGDWPPLRQLIGHRQRQTIFNIREIGLDGSIPEINAALVGIRFDGKGAAKLLFKSSARVRSSSQTNLRHWGAKCSHRFFGAACKVAMIQAQGEVISQDAAGENFVIDAVLPSGQVAFGQLRVGGDAYLILEASVEGGRTNARVSFATGRDYAGQEATLIAGCDRAFSTCKDVYDNAANYGGFPVIVQRNPAQGLGQ